MINYYDYPDYDTIERSSKLLTVERKGDLRVQCYYYYYDTLIYFEGLSNRGYYILKIYIYIYIYIHAFLLYLRRPLAACIGVAIVERFITVT